MPAREEAFAALDSYAGARRGLRRACASTFWDFFSYSSTFDGIAVRPEIIVSPLRYIPLVNVFVNVTRFELFWEARRDWKCAAVVTISCVKAENTRAMGLLQVADTGAMVLLQIAVFSFRGTWYARLPAVGTASATALDGAYSGCPWHTWLKN
jgi:hypothetical protein